MRMKNEEEGCGKVEGRSGRDEGKWSGVREEGWGMGKLLRRLKRR